MASRLCLFAACLLTAGGQALTSGHPVSMWRIDGVENEIYLLGSIHLLRERDHPIPSVIEHAYNEAEVLIMELDLDDLDPLAMAAIVNELGTIEDGGTLSEVMGTELYEQVTEYAAQLNIPIARLERSEPWLAAITVEQMILVREGFGSEYGIETHLLTKAEQDRKEILGLETPRAQLGVLDNLSLSAQRALLIQILKDSLTIAEEIDQLIDAWRRGDVEFLEQNMLAETQRFPELYNALVVKRNKAWVEKIKPLIGSEDDYLIVVGALHLIGDDGVPALLATLGIEAEQLREL